MSFDSQSDELKLDIEENKEIMNVGDVCCGVGPFSIPLIVKVLKCKFFNFLLF